MVASRNDRYWRIAEMISDFLPNLPYGSWDWKMHQADFSVPSALLGLDLRDDTAEPWCRLTREGLYQLPRAYQVLKLGPAPLIDRSVAGGLFALLPRKAFGFGVVFRRLIRYQILVSQHDVILIGENLVHTFFRSLLAVRLLNMQGGDLIEPDRIHSVGINLCCTQMEELKKT